MYVIDKKVVSVPESVQETMIMAGRIPVTWKRDRLGVVGSLNEDLENESKTHTYIHNICTYLWKSNHLCLQKHHWSIRHDRFIFPCAQAFPYFHHRTFPLRLKLFVIADIYQRTHKHILHSDMFISPLRSTNLLSVFLSGSPPPLSLSHSLFHYFFPPFAIPHVRSLLFLFLLFFIRIYVWIVAKRFNF